MESIDGSHIWLPFVGRKCSRRLEKKKLRYLFQNGMILITLKLNHFSDIRNIDEYRSLKMYFLSKPRCSLYVVYISRTKPLFLLFKEKRKTGTTNA